MATRLFPLIIATGLTLAGAGSAQAMGGAAMMGIGAAMMGGMMSGQDMMGHGQHGSGASGHDSGGHAGAEAKAAKPSGSPENREGGATPPPTQGDRPDAMRDASPPAHDHGS